MIENHPYPMGRIAEIAVMQSSAPKNSGEFVRSFGGLLAGFPEPVRFYWLYPGHEKWTVMEQGIHEIVSVPLGEGIWKDTWIQDPFHIARSSGDQLDEILIPASASRGRLENRPVPCHGSLLAHKAGWIHLEGGNMLQIGHILLCGKDLLNQHGSIQKLQENFLAVCKTDQVVWLGTDAPFTIESFAYSGHPHTSQPFFHLDLFVLPLGRTPSGIIQIGLGEIHPNFWVGIPDNAKADLEKLKEALEAIHLQLAALPFEKLEIVRIPLLLGMNGPFLRLYSHCNGYVDQVGNQRVAILPDYLLPENQSSVWQDRFRELKEVVENRLLREGIASRFIEGDFVPQANDCGSLHCRTKVIRYKI